MDPVAINQYRVGSVFSPKSQWPVFPMETGTPVLAVVIPTDGILGINHPALDGVLTEFVEPRMQLVLDVIDLREELHPLKPVVSLTFALVLPQRNEIVAGDPIGSSSIT